MRPSFWHLPSTYCDKLFLRAFHVELGSKNAKSFGPQTLNLGQAGLSPVVGSSRGPDLGA